MIINITKHIDHMEKMCKEQNLNIIIFTFIYQGISYKCFYILHGEAIIVAPEEYNMALDVSIKNKQLDNFLPEEIYLKLKVIHKKQLRTKEFCDLMLNTIINLTAKTILKVNADFYRGYRSEANNYSENERIYFYCWSRSHCGRKPTKKNLKKTKMFFGKAIYLICKLNNVSSRWKDKPKE